MLAFAVLAASLPVYLQSQDAPPRARGGRGGQRANWPPAGEAPKNVDGRPDLSGAWEPNAINANVDMVRTGVEIPFQPWAETLYKERKQNISREDPEARCCRPEFRG